MNDFLGSLIARNLTQAETLLPRPASWFEPSAPDLSSAAPARPEPVAGQEDPGAERELPWLESVDTILAPPLPAPRQPRTGPNQFMAPPPVAPAEGVATTVETLPVTPLEPPRQPRPAPSSRRPRPRPAAETPATDTLRGQAASQPHEATAPPIRPDQAPEAMQAAPTPMAPVTPSPVAARRAAPQQPKPVSQLPQPAEIAPATSSPPPHESVVAPTASSPPSHKSVVALVPQPAPRQPRTSVLEVAPRPAEMPHAERPAAASPASKRVPPAPPAQRLAPVENTEDHEPRAAARPSAEEEVRRASPVAAATVLAPLTPGGKAPATAVEPVVRVVQPASLRPAPGTLRAEQGAGPAAPEPPPTIQITIGRIEVKATPPATPTSPKRPNMPPVMTLDDYLRERANGGRR